MELKTFPPDYKNNKKPRFSVISEDVSSGYGTGKGRDIFHFYINLSIRAYRVAGCNKLTLSFLEFRNILFLQKIVLSLHLRDMGSHGPKHNIFCVLFYSKYTRKPKYHVYLLSMIENNGIIILPKANKIHNSEFCSYLVQVYRDP